jgi:hypothetical protein
MLVANDGVRKVCVVLEEIRTDSGRPVQEPVYLAAAGAVVVNPLAGRFEEDLSGLSDVYCEPLGRLLTERALAALGDRGPRRTARAHWSASPVRSSTARRSSTTSDSGTECGIR